MRPSYDDYDEFDFDFADSAAVKQILREQLREQRLLASRRAQGPGKKRKQHDFDDDFEDDDFEDDDFDEDYDDYDDEDSDSYSDRDWD